METYTELEHSHIDLIVFNIYNVTEQAKVRGHSLELTSNICFILTH